MKPYTRVISSDHTGTVEVDQVPIVNDNGYQLDNMYGIDKEALNDFNKAQGCTLTPEIIADSLFAIKRQGFNHKQNLCKDDLSITKSNELNENHSQLSKE